MLGLSSLVSSFLFMGDVFEPLREKKTVVQHSLPQSAIKAGVVGGVGYLCWRVIYY